MPVASPAEYSLVLLVALEASLEIGSAPSLLNKAISRKNSLDCRNGLTFRVPFLFGVIHQKHHIYVCACQKYNKQ